MAVNPSYIRSSRLIYIFVHLRNLLESATIRKNKFLGGSSMSKRILTIILMLTVILLGGCKEEVSSKLKGERIKFDSEESLIVQELSNENEGEYQQIKKITDKEKVDTFFKVLSNARWEDSCGKSSYPDFMIKISIRSGHSLLTIILGCKLITSKKILFFLKKTQRQFINSLKLKINRLFNAPVHSV